jgi:hypothetical protein
MSTIAVGYVVTGLVSVSMLLTARRRPRAGRLLYAALFRAASMAGECRGHEQQEEPYRDDLPPFRR